MKSIPSWKAYLLIGRLEEDKTSQQPSQDWDLDVSIADSAIHVSSKVVPGLHEGGRTAEMLRVGSWCQSPEPHIAQGWISGESGLCQAMLAVAPKAGQQLCVGRAASCSGLQEDVGDRLAGGCLAPYIQCGIVGQKTAQEPNPL